MKLINDVLDLAKIESGKMELLPTDFDLTYFLEGIVAIFRQRAEEKGLKFVFECSETLPAGIHTDETRLRQIFFNLLGNALKFTDKGTVSLIVNYQEHRLKVKIIDQGCGIAAEQLDKILLPFQQSGSNQHKAQGTGLGLPITKHMIEEVMEGRLEIDSQLGKGSRFAFEIGAPEVEAIEKSAYRSHTDFIGYTGDDTSILVVDDKEQNRGVILELLKPLGFEILEASDGIEAIEMAKKYHPRLILLDLVMPNMNGFECAKKLRDMREFDDTVIIAASASVLQHQTQEAINSGCDAFLPKPIRAEALFNDISRFLDIQWIYSQPVVEETTAQDNNEDSKEIIGPKGQEAEELYDLASLGDIEEILNKLDALEQEQPDLSMFAQQARQLAQNYQVEKLESLMKEYVESS